MKLRLVAAAGCAITLSTNFGGATADAQTGAPPTRIESPDRVLRLNAESAFSDYQPFREEKLRSWKEANQEVADHPGMGSMGSMGNMPGMASKNGTTPKGIEGAAGRGMVSTKDMRGMDSGKTPMTNMPGNAMAAMGNKAATGMGASHEDHGKMAMTKPSTVTSPSDSSHSEWISGTAVVQGIDKAGARVKLTHDPIALCVFRRT